jgi:hypothetical protein
MCGVKNEGIAIDACRIGLKAFRFAPMCVSVVEGAACLPQECTLAAENREIRHTSSRYPRP